MGVQDLGIPDQDIAWQCLQYVLRSGYFDDGDDFHTRLGLTKEALEGIALRWPYLNDDTSHDDFLAVNNCFNEMCHGVRFLPGEWEKWFSVSESEVCQAYQHWLEIRRRINPKNMGGGLR